MKKQSPLYALLEKILRTATKPMTCVEVYDMPEVREIAGGVGRVSDYMGGLWRKGKAARSAANTDSNDGSRWAYSWRTKPLSSANAVVDDVEYIKKLVDRPNISITEDGDTLTIDLPNFKITVQSK